MEQVIDTEDLLKLFIKENNIKMINWDIAEIFFYMGTEYAVILGDDKKVKIYARREILLPIDRREENAS